MGGRIRVVAAAVSLAAVAAFIPLPSSADTAPSLSVRARPAESSRVGAGEAVPGTDMVIPPAGTPKLRRPATAETRAASPAIYDVRLFTMTTADGPVGLSNDVLTRMVVNTDAWFDGVTGGSYRFRLAGDIVRLPPTTKSVCGLDVPAQAVAPYLPLPVSAGATDTIWVVVTSWEIADECGAAGVGYLGAPGVWIRGDSREDQLLATLAHEIGHNLGLGHSQAVVPVGREPSWPSGGSPELSEYGDTLDFMGIGGFYACTVECAWQQADAHAHNLNLLGVLPESAIGHVAAGDDTVMTLARIDAGQGVRAIYLPWLNRAKLVLDYRPPGFQDGNADGPYGPGAGVVVRLVDSAPDSGPAPYVAGNGTAALSAPVLPPSKVIRVGVGAGAGRVLPDGTTIEVLSMDATAAAVRIVRPGDASPPALPAGALGQCRAFTCSVPAKSALWETGKATYPVAIAATDDQWLSSVNVSVRGDATVDLGGSRPAPGVRDSASTIPQEVVLAPGRYTVTVSARDLVGKTASATWSLTLSEPRPTRSWYPAGSGLSWNWMEYEQLRCWQSGQVCVGIAVWADRACTRSVIARLSSVREGGSVIQTRTVRLGPLPRGRATAMVATFSKDVEKTHTFALTSLSCSRR